MSCLVVRIAAAAACASLITVPAVGAAPPLSIELRGSESRTITADAMIAGPITIADDAVLTIRGATVRVVHPSTDPRANIWLTGHARLVLEDAALLPQVEHPDNLYLYATDQSAIEVTDSAYINVIDLTGQATLTGMRARIASSLPPIDIAETDGAFGIVQLSNEARASFTDSTVGSFGFSLGALDDVRLTGLKPQLYADFDLARDAARWTPRFDVVLRNTRVLPVVLHGPFERSWTIVADPAAHLAVTDSSLNKLCLNPLRGETLTFRNLPIGRPVTFDFRDIHLANASVANEWGFFATDSNITVENSRGVWLWPIGTGSWVLRNSQMIEFDPRQFTGTLSFVHGEWANAGEVFQGSAVTLKGSFIVTQHLDQHLVLADSTMRREYLVRAVDSKGRLLGTFTATLRRGGEVVRGQAVAGLARVTIGFAVGNYTKPLVLTVTAKGRSVVRTISLFSNTPITVRLPT